jgi:hypothetical protein
MEEFTKLEEWAEELERRSLKPPFTWEPHQQQDSPSCCLESGRNQGLSAETCFGRLKFLILLNFKLRFSIKAGEIKQQTQLVGLHMARKQLLNTGRSNPDCMFQI